MVVLYNSEVLSVNLLLTISESMPQRLTPWYAVTLLMNRVQHDFRSGFVDVFATLRTKLLFCLPAEGSHVFLCLFAGLGVCPFLPTEGSRDKRRAPGGSQRAHVRGGGGTFRRRAGTRIVKMSYFMQFHFSLLDVTLRALLPRG